MKCRLCGENVQNSSQLKEVGACALCYMESKCEIEKYNLDREFGVDEYIDSKVTAMKLKGEK